MIRQSGYYVWIGGEKSWHRTRRAAERRASKAQSQGYTVQIDCCRCGNRLDNCPYSCHATRTRRTA
jgi:hypothetical protein